MDDDRTPGANWYADPAGVGELRWFDGSTWTAHVSAGGRTWSAPPDGATEPPSATVAALADGPTSTTTAPPAAPGVGRSPLTVDRLLVARPAQPRGQGAWLDLYDDGGTLGRVVETTSAEVADSIIATVSDAGGAPLLTVTHPGSSARARVDGPGGTLGFVARVGRVRANWELHGPGRAPSGRTLATLRPLEGAGAAWEARNRRQELVAVLRAWSIGPPTEATYGEARYEIELGPAADVEVRPLLLAIPLLADRTAQALTPAG